MKNRKIVTLFIAMLMLIALLFVSACDSGVNRPEDAEEVVAVPETTEVMEAEEPDEVEEPEEIEEPEETVESEELDESEKLPSLPENTIRRGTWKNGIYTNESAGLQFLLPDGWVIATDREIADMMGIGLEFFTSDSDTDINNLMDSLNINTIYDMLVTDASGASIMIAFEKLIYPANNFNEDQYIDAAGKALIEMGMDAIVTNNNNSVKIGDNMWCSFSIEVDFGGIIITMHNFVVIHNEYAVLLQFTYNDASDSIDYLLSLFFGMNDPVPVK